MKILKSLIYREIPFTLTKNSRLVEAIASFRKVLTLAPNDPLAHFNFGVSLLRNGEFDEGWKHFEWRTDHSDQTSQGQSSSAPNWNGEDISGKRILLKTEYGFGDSIQFVRYARLLVVRGAIVFLQCEPELTRIFQSIRDCNITSTEAAPPTVDYQVRLLSLPHILATTLQTIPASMPYLRPPAEETRKWAEYFAKAKRPLIGLAWFGDSRHGEFDRRRSVTLETLAPLLRTPATFVSLQKGIDTEHINRAAPHLLNPMGECGDFADTASIIENLDLIISVDTSVAHLAGALAKPVWLLSRFDADWRWLNDREDSPWYPTMRIFRQPTPGDWAAVVTRTWDQLQSLSEKARVEN